MLVIIENRDKELAQEAENQLNKMKQKYGKRYCPCSLVRSQDTICPCLEFRQQETEGQCHCGRYEKVFNN